MASQTIQLGAGAEATIAIDDDPSSDVVRLTAPVKHHPTAVAGLCLEPDEPWAVLDIREGGHYGRVVSRHPTGDAAETARVTHATQQLEGTYGRRHAETQDAIPHLMWVVERVGGAVGQRVRYR